MGCEDRCSYKDGQEIFIKGERVTIHITRTDYVGIGDDNKTCTIQKLVNLAKKKGVSEAGGTALAEVCERGGQKVAASLTR